MATIQQSLAVGTLATTTLTTLFTADFGSNVSPTLVITNISAAKTTVSVFINNGTADFLLIKRTVPAGIGKTWRVLEMSDLKLNALFVVKIQLDSTDPINFFLSGSVITA